jgi:4-hydroxybenzoate polyprenyltransferase
VRLKARPVVDILSHVLMLSALLFLAGYFAYDSAPGAIWLVALGAALASAYGQLYNQVRDYDVDRAAGLRNTASLVGEQGARRLMYLSMALAALCLVATVLLGLWPLWLLVVPVVLAPLLLVFRPKTDARGTTAIDASGRVQMGFLIVANAVVVVWLVAALLR